jgi:putative glutathione S-transferase
MAAQRICVRMGQLIDGVWHKGWYDPDARGAFQRPKTKFRNWIRKDGTTGFTPDAGRYHLYVSYACPWAHRSIITRSIRGLEDAISMTVVDPKMSDEGWSFSGDEPDPLFGEKYLRDIYLRAKRDYSGRVTVPVLWDKKTNTIVSNESREVMRMLDLEFDDVAKTNVNLAPALSVGQIEETLDAIYQPINNGVYRAGFATTQEAYDEAVTELFTELDRWEAVLGKRHFLCGDVLTEADIALYTTLVRFDLVYYAHFKCNIRRIADYPNLSRFLKELYAMPEIKRTTEPRHIKVHYYWSQTTVNPTRIVPLGPHVDL